MALDLNKHVARVLFVVDFIVILLLSRTLLSIAAIYLLHAMCAAVAADADYVFTQLQEQALEEQAQALSAHIQQAALHQALYKVHKARNWRSRSCPCLFCQGSRCKTNSMPTKRSRSPARTVIVSDAEAEDESPNKKKPKSQPEVSVPVAVAQLSSILQLFHVPAEWIIQDVKELCGLHGTIQNAQPLTSGSFVVTYTDSDAARRAATALSGLQIPCENGVCSLRCCITVLLSIDVSAFAADSDSADIADSAPKASDSTTP